MNKYMILCFSILFAQALFGQKKASIHELDINNGLFFIPNHMEPFTGTAVSDFPNGKKQLNAGFKDGKLHGASKEWARNGQKVFEVDYNNGLKDGIEKQWYVSGAKKLETQYINGVVHGTCTEWHKNEAKKSEGKFEQNKEVGEHLWWYNTGEKDQSVTYVNGLTHGTVSNWYKSGQLSLESRYDMGKKQGDTKQWFENGQLKKEEFFKDDRLDGIATTYGKDGRLLGRQTYKLGSLIKDENFRSGSIRTPEGFMQVFNEYASFFMIHIKGEKVAPRYADAITYNLDGELFQIYTQDLADIELAANAPDEESRLNAAIQAEQSFIEEMIEQKIEINSNVGKTKNGQQYIHWWFVSPSSKDEEQKPRTVQEEHYFTTICNKKLLSLYSVVTNSDTQNEIVNMLTKQINNLEVVDKRIELNSLTKTLLK